MRLIVSAMAAACGMVLVAGGVGVPQPAVSALGTAHHATRVVAPAEKDTGVVPEAPGPALQLLDELPSPALPVPLPQAPAVPTPLG